MLFKIVFSTSKSYKNVIKNTRSNLDKKKKQYLELLLSKKWLIKLVFKHNKVIVYNGIRKHVVYETQLDKFYV